MALTPKQVREKAMDDAAAAKPNASLSTLVADAQVIADKYNHWLDTGSFTSPPPPTPPAAPPAASPQ